MVIIRKNVEHNDYSDEAKKYFTDYPFSLDTFQKDAIDGLIHDKHILITAHTGSGKTLPAEFAINYFTSLGKKVIYTSPIKSLSNQKFHEFTDKFSTIDVGILTGDIKFNPEADCIIMTTEILRNTLTQMKLIKENMIDSSKASLHFEMDLERELACVIFDEVHYINDKDRGKVWEETMVLLPEHVQMLMLSATIDRPEEFASWIETTKHKETWLCPTNHRVVPLYHYSFKSIPKSLIDKITDKSIKTICEKHSHSLIPLKEEKKSHILQPRTKELYAIEKYMYKNGHRINQKYTCNQVANYMKDNGLLPGILFIFSRNGANKMRSQLEHSLFTEEESIKSSIVEKECRTILRKLPNHHEYTMLPEFNDIVTYLRKGIAVHHSGVLPVFREMIEILYSKGFIKLLIATETFAVGINMPTKCVVFTSTQKFDGTGFRYLMSHEYTQMAGRAGRRGLDDKGVVIHLTDLFELPQIHNYELMLNGPPQRLTSKFKINASLVLQLLESNPEKCSSFFQSTFQHTEHETQHKIISSKIDEERKVMENEMKSLENYSNFDQVKHLVEAEDALQYAPNKKKKKLQRTIQTIQQSADKRFDYYVNKYKELQKKHTNVERDSSSIEHMMNYHNDQVSQYMYYLTEANFIQSDEISQLTHKGIAATMILEANGIIMSDLFHNGVFNDMTPKQLSTVLSLFVPVHVKEEYEQQTCNCEDEIIIQRAKECMRATQKYYDLELKHIQDIDNNQYICHYNLIPYIHNWFDVSNEQEALGVIQSLASIELHVGEFVKIILKLTNIIQELIKVSEYFGNVPLEHALTESLEKLLKFVATNQSLYV